MPANNSVQPIAEILDVTKICATFPQYTGIQIPRDNIHHTLDTILDGEIHLLTVEGPDGIGKTTLLSQFARLHLDKCFSMFVRPTSRFAYRKKESDVTHLNSLTQLSSLESITFQSQNHSNDVQ